MNRHPNDPYPRTRPLPTEHPDFHSDAEWYRPLGSRATAEDWPQELHLEAGADGLGVLLVREIQRRHRETPITYKELAAEYRVSVWTIGRIVRREGRAGARMLAQINREAA